MNSAPHAIRPALPLMAMGALVLLTLLSVTAVRLTGVGGPAGQGDFSGAAARSDQSAAAPALRERLLRFEDRSDGGITIADARSGLAIDSVAPGTNGFLRSAMRGLVRERKRQGIGAEPPFRLVARADGRLLLEDPGTGRHIDLQSFGPTNAGVFARLLADPAARAAGPAS